MNIVFFGTSGFAVPSLEKILGSSHKVLALVTQPDRKSGRRLKLLPPPTKVVALAKDIDVYQPQDASSAKTIDYLKILNSDLFVVVSFGQILKKDVLSIPKRYTINLHASLLPKYRGAAPTNWAIINGDKSTGVTVMKMSEKMDEGDIILQRKAEISERDTNISLSEKLSKLGAEALLETIDLIADGKEAFVKQDDSQTTYAPKLKKEDGLISWKMNALEIHNRVRGLFSWPGAYTYYEKKILKILEVEISPCSCAKEKVSSGEVIEAAEGKGIIVHASSGDLRVKYLQLEGKKMLDADSFLRGHRIKKGYIFG